MGCFYYYFYYNFAKNKRLYYVVTEENIQAKRSFSVHTLTLYLSCWFEKCAYVW